MKFPPLSRKVEQLHTYVCEKMHDVAAVPPQLSQIAALANAKCGGRGSIGGGCVPLGLPQSLLLEEKKFLLAVVRGDIANVRRILQKAHRRHHININCMDPMGRRALTLAIDNENLEMVELLVIMGVETKDALLHAINAEFIEAVELLLEHEELIYKEGERYSWQKVDTNTATFPPDITPLILAAHKNNFEILKILLDRGAAVPVPHDIRCNCDECVRMSSEDSLRHSLSRVNIYRAITSPSLICLTSSDPILTAFQLSWELRNLALTEQECRADYKELRRQCQQFAVNLLDQTRTSSELAILLNHDPELSSYEPGDRMRLTRLVEAISYKQKQFVAHSNIQQLLSTIWYDGLPGFRRMGWVGKALCIAKITLLFPFYCLIYMIAPNCNTGTLMRKPFMKFLVHASSYLFFLFVLILVSQRADREVIRILGTEHMRAELREQERRQRGNAPTYLELLLVLYVFGFVWEELQEVYTVGIRNYLRNLWNFIDFLRNSLYLSVMAVRTYAYIQQCLEISRDPQMAFVPREKWNDFDPQLIAEGLFAAANVFSALKLVHLFSVNPHLGPLQISLGRMVIDIVKFFFIYMLVLFSFACGLNGLLWYFAKLEKEKCFSGVDGAADWIGHADECGKWRRFANLFESSQSLFWASFGMVDLGDFELTGIKTYTRFWGLLMFGSYCVINVIVLLNLLIAMMSNSYAKIDQDSDTEWKFARTKLWMSYFEDSPTLPPPFNIMPSVKLIIRMFRKSSKQLDRKRSKKRNEKNPSNVHDNIMRSLVWRYVTLQQRKFEENPISEDDINEVKSEISSMRCEMLEIYQRNGFDISTASKREKYCRAKHEKVWERRLMKGFQVAPVCTVLEKDPKLHNVNGAGEMSEVRVEKVPSKPLGETPIQRFRRVAYIVAAQTASHRWSVVLRGVARNSQIGKSFNHESLRHLEQLGKAIEEARKLYVTHSDRDSPIPIEFDDERDNSLFELLNQISSDASTEGRRVQLGAKKTTSAPDQRPLFLRGAAIINAAGRSGTLPDIERVKKVEVKVGETVKPKPKLQTQTTVQPNAFQQQQQQSQQLQQQLPQQQPKQQQQIPPQQQQQQQKPHELQISVKKLHDDQQSMVGKILSTKKIAPTVPKQAPVQAYTPTPFTVELGGAGRHPSFRKTGGAHYANLPSGGFDLKEVELDAGDNQSFTSADNASEVSSIAGMRDSPIPEPKPTSVATKKSPLPDDRGRKWL